MDKKENNGYKTFDEQDCSEGESKKGSKFNFDDDKDVDWQCEYFEEEPDLFHTKIDPVDPNWGDIEWGGIIDDRTGLRIAPSYFVKRVMSEHRFITPTDTDELHLFQNGIYNSSGEKQIRHLLAEKFGTIAHRRVVGEIIQHLKDKTFLPRDDINQFDGYIPLFNGLLNTENWRVEKFSPDKLFTYKLPIRYSKKAECPNFMAFLEDICKGQEEEIPFLQEWTGYMLYPSYPNLISLWITGPTHTGKTTIIKVWQNLLGRENVLNEDLATFDRRGFELANLYGKLANFSGEITTDRSISATTFQLITGQDYISSHIKYQQETRNFVSYAKIVVYGNKLPKIPPDFATADSYWIRIRPLVLKNQHITNADREILNEITTDEELSGILNWGIAGLKQVKENNWEFTKTKGEEENRFIIMLASNPILAFFHRHCERDRDAVTPIEEIHEAYTKFCEKYDLEEKGMKQFNKELGDVSGVETKKRGSRGEQINHWVGLKLKEKI